MWQRDCWGYKARIGVLVPHNDVVPESELWAMTPEGVSIHAGRVPFGWHGEMESAPLDFSAPRSFAEPPHVDNVVELLTDAPLNIVAYGFTSSSYLLGPDGDVSLKGRLEERSHGLAVLIPCLSAVLALRTLGVQRLALIHPPWFTEELDSLGTKYFRHQGFTVVHSGAVRLPRGQLNIQPAEVHEWVCSHVPRDAEGVFVGGNGFRVIGAIHAIEQKLGVPILAANQVLLWHALQTLRVTGPVTSYGQIFEHELPH